MNLRPAQIDIIVEDCIRLIEGVLPKSSAALWQSEGYSAHSVDDTKLLRLMRVSRESAVLRFCEDVHKRVLFARVGRVSVEGDPLFSGTSSNTARRPTGHEVAKALGMTSRTYRRHLTEARKRVDLAVSDMMSSSKNGENAGNGRRSANGR